MEGQLALAALFLNAMKEQRRQGTTAHGNDSANISSGVPEVPSQQRSASEHLQGSRAQSPEADIISDTAGRGMPTPNTSTSVVNASFAIPSPPPATHPPSIESPHYSMADVPAPTPPVQNFPPVSLPDNTAEHATSTPPPTAEGTWW
jgi:hypothetical protein